MSEQIVTKRCSHCKQVKPLSEFTISRTGKFGRHNQCKICKRITQKRFRQSEKSVVYQKKYSKNIKAKACKKRYAQSEKGKAAQRRYLRSEKGKAKKVEMVNRWRVAHPEHRKAQTAVKRAIEKGILPELDSIRCHYCRAQAQEYHHHKGYAKEHQLDVIPVCKICHNKISTSRKALRVACHYNP